MASWLSIATKFTRILKGKCGLMSKSLCWPPRNGGEDQLSCLKNYWSLFPVQSSKDAWVTFLPVLLLHPILCTLSAFSHLLTIPFSFRPIFFTSASDFSTCISREPQRLAFVYFNTWFLQNRKSMQRFTYSSYSSLSCLDSQKNSSPTISSCPWDFSTMVIYRRLALIESRE